MIGHEAVATPGRRPITMRRPRSYVGHQGGAQPEKLLGGATRVSSKCLVIKKYGSG